MTDRGWLQGPTIYPILFAAIVGRALKSIAFWKLEKGGKIGTMDQLLGSMTITQTILTQVQMRSLGFLGLLLVAIWSLSPLGGQASLRIIGATFQAINTTRPLQYINTSSSILSLHYAGGDTAQQFVPVSALFGAALVGRSSEQASSIDNWGNLKIPRIESLDTSTKDIDGWYPIPPLNSSDDYASLIGVPFSMVSNENNVTTSFNIETSYWALLCPVFGTFVGYESVSATDPNKKWDLNLTTGNTAATKINQNLYLTSETTLNYSQPLDSQVNASLRHIIYSDRNNDPADLVGANCTIKTSYVEVSIVCSKDSCASVAIEKSRKPLAPESWTPFDSSATAFYWFSDSFSNAFLEGHSVMPTPYQKFIINPQAPFDPSFHVPPITVVSNATFALRLGQLFNTYWMAMLAPTAVPKGLRNSNLTADTAPITGTLQQSTTAIVTRHESILACDPVWFIVLLLSSAITALTGLCGLIATICRRGPDISFNISSLVKDNPFVDQTPLTTTLDGSDRARLMKNLYAKYGDVASEQEIGYIAIGSGNVAKLQRGRLYR